jgi:hypothetical protein
MGSDDIESDVLRHEIEIRVVVKELQPVRCAKRADEHVDRLSRGERMPCMTSQ